jgi:hypothetical protein
MASKKDYITVSNSVRRVYREGGNDVWPHLDRLVIDMSIMFMRDNSRFNPTQFATACGMSESVAKAVDWVSRSANTKETN